MLDAFDVVEADHDGLPGVAADLFLEIHRLAVVVQRLRFQRLVRTFVVQVAGHHDLRRLVGAVVGPAFQL